MALPRKTCDTADLVWDTRFLELTLFEKYLQIFKIFKTFKIFSLEDPIDPKNF